MDTKKIFCILANIIPDMHGDTQNYDKMSKIYITSAYIVCKKHFYTASFYSPVKMKLLLVKTLNSEIIE